MVRKFGTPFLIQIKSSGDRLLGKDYFVRDLPVRKQFWWTPPSYLVVLCISILIIWLQQHARSDWLFSCNDRPLLARCPRQSVFKLIVDSLMDLNVVFNWQLSKRVSADQCQLTVLLPQVYNSLRWRIF